MFIKITSVSLLTSIILASIPASTQTKYFYQKCSCPCCRWKVTIHICCDPRRFWRGWPRKSPAPPVRLKTYPEFPRGWGPSGNSGRRFEAANTNSASAKGKRNSVSVVPFSDVTQGFPFIDVNHVVFHFVTVGLHFKFKQCCYLDCSSVSYNDVITNGDDPHNYRAMTTFSFTLL